MRARNSGELLKALLSVRTHCREHGRWRCHLKLKSCISWSNFDFEFELAQGKACICRRALNVCHQKCFCAPAKNSRMLSPKAERIQQTNTKCRSLHVLSCAADSVIWKVNCVSQSERHRSNSRMMVSTCEQAFSGHQRAPLVASDHTLSNFCWQVEQPLMAG